MWAAELRCPKTLMARIETCSSDRQQVTWNERDVDGDIYVMPGVVTNERLVLEGAELSAIWKDILPLQAPRGWWLVRGNVRRTKTLAESLLKFVLEENAESGRIEVKPDRSSGRLRFTVHVDPDLFEHVKSDRTLKIAALVGACGWLPEIFRLDDPAADEDPLATQLRELLTSREPDVRLWDHDLYDPALVATILEPLHFDSQDPRDG